MKRVRIAAVSIVLAASACATSRAQQQGSSVHPSGLDNSSAYAVSQDLEGDPEDVFYCDWEHVVGTNIRQRVCWDEEALYRQRQLFQTWVDAYLLIHNVQRR